MKEAALVITIPTIGGQNEFRMASITHRDSNNLAMGRYVESKGLIKILRGIADQIEKKQYTTSENEMPKKLINISHLSQKGILAYEPNAESCIVTIASGEYYIPYRAEHVFKIKLPSMLGCKFKQNCSLFWYEGDVQDTTNIYPLQIGHVSHSGEVCIGNFNENFDINNPKEYFRKLIEYPVGHAHDVAQLRQLEKEGWDSSIGRSNSRKFINLILKNI